MNKIFKIAFCGLMGVGMLSACSDDKLDVNSTQSVSGDDLMSNPTTALIPLNGIYRSMYTAGWSTPGNTHQCFGISAYNLMAEVMGDDMIMGDMGSGWFWFDAVYNVKARFTSKSWRSYDLWKAYTTWVSNANAVINAETTMQGAQKEIDYVIGQAYAIRAYSYFMMAQTFSRTYAGHENEPCVPVYTKITQAGDKGAPRSTVAQVYERVNADIDKAVSLLEGTVQTHKSHIGYAVALGLKARMALVQENWQAAKDAAHAAIAAGKGSIVPVKDFIGLNDISKPNVMWGAEIIMDQRGQYASLFAHMDTVIGYGKTAPKLITRTLYDKMSATDARRAWWNEESPLSGAGVHQCKMTFKDAQTWLGDYVWMRVEEMYLIAAEAECRLGDEASAKADLMALMSQRDPNYNLDGKTGTALGKLTNEFTGSLLEEIIIQRRLELWGEAGRIYDIRRLRQGFRRVEADGWNSEALLTTRPTDNPESYMWVLTIPQSEFDGNDSLDQSKDQNPVGDL